MKLKVKYQGYSPMSLTPYAYHILTETGHADMIYEPNYFNEKEIEVADELFSEGSGWANVICIKCNTDYQERTRIGNVIACPVCGEPLLVDETIELDSSNLVEDEY